MQKVAIDPTVDFAQLSDKTEGYSGDDITNICRDAAMNQLRRRIEGLSVEEIMQLKGKEQVDEPITWEDFEQAIVKIKPSVGKDDVVRHEKWLDEFGSV